MNRHHYVVIMAGGIGSRFWPMSRQNFPKQFLDILNTGKTLIQWTFDRFAAFIPKENIFDKIKVLTFFTNSSVITNFLSRSGREKTAFIIC